MEKIGASYGMSRFFQAISNFFGPIVAGLIWEQTGSLDYAFYFMAAAMTVGAAIAATLPFAAKAAKEKKEKASKKKQQGAVI